MSGTNVRGAEVVANCCYIAKHLLSFIFFPPRILIWPCLCRCICECLSVMCVCSPLVSRRWLRPPDGAVRGWGSSSTADETSKMWRHWSCCQESASSGAREGASSLVTHTQPNTRCPSQHFPAVKWSLRYCLVQLTVEIAAQQLQSESRLLHKNQWLNPDVASHKRWREVVVFHPGAVQVAVKYLKERHTDSLTFINHHHHLCCKNVSLVFLTLISTTAWLLWLTQTKEIKC